MCTVRRWLGAEEKNSHFSSISSSYYDSIELLSVWAALGSALEEEGDVKSINNQESDRQRPRAVSFVMKRRTSKVAINFNSK